MKMKSILNKVIFAGILFMAFYGCSEENPLNTNVSEVERLHTPDDGYSVTLDPEGSLSFEWAPAKAEDGGFVMYEVAFDTVGGDFSNPIYRVISDNNGAGNTATISHKTLNKAAASAGLESEETGKLIWTAISSRGVNEQVGPENRTIQITRLPGFADPPTTLYITGAGTETGSDLSNAIQAKATEEGLFEIYTELTTDGPFKFVNNTSDSPREFVLVDGSISENGSAPTIEQNGVYRINLDFTVGAATITEIKEIELFFAPNNEFLFELPYQGNGVWKAEEQPIEFRQESWGRDERYKFRMTVNNGEADEYEWWGSINNDNSRPDDSTPDSFYYLYPAPSDQWSHSFKFRTEIDMSYSDVTVYFQADREYTHEVIKVRDQ